MSPEEKLILDIETSLDKYRANITNWEIDFLNSVRDILMDKYKSPSFKQKNMCRAIVDKSKIKK